MTRDLKALFDRHARVAFQLSGGRDSCAALWVMRDWLPRMTVYFMDTGDDWPETLDVVARMEGLLGFTALRIQSDARRWRAQHGDPTDVLPARATAIGQMVSGCPTRLCTRYDCCWANIMQPMHQRMRDDGVTCIVRGVRNEDFATPPLPDGGMADGMEVFYPIWTWSADDVDACLKDNGLPRAAWYDEGAAHGSDCMSCTAWWDDGRQAYMARHYPDAYRVFRANLRRIGAALVDDMGRLEQLLAPGIDF